jgi:hypothetical protein
MIIYTKKIINGIALNVKNVWNGENGIVENVINVCIELTKTMIFV